MKTSTRERRDWSLLIFLIPIGILLMLIAGQIAIRLSPFWSLAADMRSKLDPNTAPKRQMGIVQPIGAGILTPYDVNLTPDSGGGVVFPPIVILEPNGTVPVFNSPVPTVTPIPPATATLAPTQVRPTYTPTDVPTSSFPYPTATKKLTNTPVRTATRTPTRTPTRTATITKTPTKTPTRTVTPTGTITPTPTRTFTPTFTLTFTQTNTPTITPTFTQTNTPTITPTFTPTDTPTITPTFTQTDTPTITPTPAGYPSTIDPGLILVPPNVVIGPPDTTITSLSPGQYTVITLSSPIVVGMADGYDMVYYESEFNGSGFIYLDSVILGISTSPTGSPYYTVFNFGDGIPDINTNISGFPDVDNQGIPISALYDFTNYPGNPSTGILIDVDIAPSQPPSGSYGYLVVICPPMPPSTQSLQVDSIEIWP